MYLSIHISFVVANLLIAWLPISVGGMTDVILWLALVFFNGLSLRSIFEAIRWVSKVHMPHRLVAFGLSTSANFNKIFNFVGV